ncbi:MAG TPA: OmpA family protein [Bryobacteraceae bacterium]|nr:OmpA family protein [Bryobacteraceae bacterium]
MGRRTWIIGVAVLVAAVSVSEYAGYRSLKTMRGEVEDLQRQVDETTKQLNESTKKMEEESAAVAASSKSAQEAAGRAAIAAELRNQAEASKQEAEAGKQQAEAAAQQAQTAAQQANEQAREAQSKMSQMRLEREQELNRMQEALNRVAETHRTPTGMTIVLPNSIFRFDFDKANLSQPNRELLSRIAGILLASKAYGLSIFGYTDDIGTPEYNEELSVRRADAVRHYLIQAGIDSSIINVKGYGKTSPLVEGKTSDARAKNRRVEIAVTDSSIRFQ